MTPWKKWSDGLAQAVASVPDRSIRRAAEAVAAARLVLTAGNGGSSALASHLAQACLKPDYQAGGGRAAVCLTDNVPTMTAHANDGGWEGALLEVARPFLDDIGDGVVLVAISSSGKSENIARLAREAKRRGFPVVALTGFLGEPLRSLATVSLHAKSMDYEVVEPAHDAVIHRLQAHLRDVAKTG